MTKALLAILCLIIVSCNPASITELEDLKQDNASLRIAIDSLRKALSVLTYRQSQPVKTKKKKTSKKGTLSAPRSQAIPYSAFASAPADKQKPAPAERTTYQTAPEPVRYTPSRAVSSYSGRCQAMTKKGMQCKRTASGGSYCWQHGR